MMKRKDYQVAFPVALVVVMVAFLSTIFFANANRSCAADSGQKKSPAVVRTTAVEQTEARIKQLQDSLKITKDQEVLWNNLTQVMRENAKDMDTLTKDMTGKTKTMNAVEHMKFHRQITEAHLDQLKKLIPPFESFYAGLSDQQKKITDTIFRTGKCEKPKSK